MRLAVSILASYTESPTWGKGQAIRSHPTPEPLGYGTKATRAQTGSRANTTLSFSLTRHRRHGKCVRRAGGVHEEGAVRHWRSTR
ncbi:hypothetical protein BU23DRAFT_551693 [Bimuria novae-zelandiae CBS 107.79]|uniref:Uncharacterized protein n=1 Tax=Bimuria novae-zelandiae CBS 107.79 TaxID=1447943 RepID=A0A6A5VGP8_9PLEO|nr:hypothetical protein BU23DRAFT_551693 [Bimuria novae-zelandiae CBS 107.79]